MKKHTKTKIVIFHQINIPLFIFLLKFQVSSGRQWYLHSIYTVESSTNGGIGKRSAEMHSFMGGPAAARRSRRQAADFTEIVDNIGDGGIGTNMHMVKTSTSTNDIKNSNVGNTEKGSNSTTVIPVIAIITVLALVMLVIIIVAAVMRRRRVSSKPNPPVTVVSHNGGATVMDAHFDDGDNTEV